MRYSLKRLEKLSECFGYRIYKDQRLGNRKDYYYYYEILDKNNNKIEGSESIKELMNYLLDHGEEVTGE